MEETKQKKTAVGAIVTCCVAWFIPIIGVPWAIYCIVRARKQDDDTLLTVAIVSLGLGIINASIGAVLGYQSVP